MKKKIDRRLSGTRRIKSSGNVFADLGFDPAEPRSWRCAPMWQDFSLDMLLTLAARAGLKRELKLAA